MKKIYLFLDGNKHCRVGTNIMVGRVSGNTAIFYAQVLKACQWKSLRRITQPPGHYLSSLRGVSSNKSIN